LHALELLAQGLQREVGEQRRPVAVALRASDRELAAGEVDVLDAQAVGLEQAQPRAEEQGRDEARCAIHLPWEAQDLGAREDGRQVPRLFGAHDRVHPGELALEHVLVEDEQRGQGLVLRRGGHPARGREVGQERADLGLAELGGVAPVRRLRWRTRSASTTRRRSSGPHEAGLRSLTGGKIDARPGGIAWSCRIPGTVRRPGIA
jgi:hypothetical protein